MIEVSSTGSIQHDKAETLFFDTYHPQIKDVFSIVGLPDSGTDTLEGAVELTQPWVEGDHSRPKNKIDLDEAQRQDLQPIFEDLGMMRERPFPPGHYDQIIVLGAIHAGNIRRAEFVGRMLSREDITTDRVVLLGGQRRIYEEREMDDIATNLGEIYWDDSGDEWVENFKADIFAGDADKRWETDLIRLAAVAKVGPLTLKKLHLELGDIDLVRRYEFDLNGLPVSLLHTRAVERPNGEPRHTTEACIKDWVETFEPAKDAHVGMVGANPHADRMVRSARAVLSTIERGDIDLTLGSAIAPAGIRESIYLGEIARSLYEDLRSKES